MAVMPPIYRIHPAIGFARVGDAAPDEFFVGPEIPNQPVRGAAGIGKSVPPFKAGGQMRPQAARFRVFEYVDKGGFYQVSREINLSLADVAELTWTVHLANRKASFFTFDGLAGSTVLPVQPAHPRRNAAVVNRRSLEIDPGPRSIKGKSAGPVEFKKGNSANPARELWPNPAPSPAIDYLGQLRTDPDGRLIVIGGKGVAAKQPAAGVISNYANNDGWFDDVSDGPVTATLKLKSGGRTATVTVAGAWILVGPPDFAPDLKPMVTMWDLLFDLAARKIPLPVNEEVYRSGSLKRLKAIAAELSRGSTSFTTYKPSFDDDIAPILRQAIHSRWSFGPAQARHVSFGALGPVSSIWKAISDPTAPNNVRQLAFNYTRKPGTPGTAGIDTMPRLLGDDPYDKFSTHFRGLWVTITQYAVLEQWSKGNFIAPILPASSLLKPPVPGAVTPDGLDRAALESASGGAFFPGIEVGWQIREHDLYVLPFRIKHGAASKYVGDRGVTVGPGYFSRQMALPWLADFLQCKTETQRANGQRWGWWPSQRPDDVYANAADAAAMNPMLPWHRATVGGSSNWPGRGSSTPTYNEMIANWSKFAVIVEKPGDVFVEDERAGSIP